MGDLLKREMNIYEYEFYPIVREVKKMEDDETLYDDFIWMNELYEEEIEKENLFYKKLSLCELQGQ